MRILVRAAATSLMLVLALISTGKGVTFRTYITGESGVGTLAEKHVIFTMDFDASTPYSGTIVTELEDPIHRLDGIDFVPGTGETEVVAAGTHLVGADGFIGHYDVSANVILPPNFIASTKGAPPAPTRTTHPSSVKSLETSTGSYVYYVENQFGFEAADPDRIMRVPLGVGKPVPAAETVFTAGVAGLTQLEGLEVHDGRLYFFALDPDTTSPTLKRALFSMPLTPAGLPAGAPVKELGGLTRGAGVAGVAPTVSDGSDELDFDPYSGLLWGTNIIDGQLIAYDPISDTGAVVLDATTIATGSDFGYKLLTRGVDGIRSTGEGHLIFAGLDGTIGSIDLTGFVSGGGLGFGSILDTDIFALFDDRLDDGMGVDLEFHFDDLTPLSLVGPLPEPGSFLLTSLSLLAICAIKRRPRELRL